METLGLYFEDFPVGKTGRSVGKTVTLTDIQFFKEMSGWPDYVISGKQAAPEMQITMISAGLMTRQGFYEGTLVGIINNDWRYAMPVFAGDTLKISYVVADAIPTKKGNKGIIVFKIRTYNQRNETVAEGEMKTMMLTRVNKPS